MSFALVAARLLLALVLALAGASKLAGRSALRETVREFGLPERLAGPVAVVLPPVELALAALLVPAAAARWSAAAAGALLLAFSAAIAHALARGDRPGCGCFGRLRSAPISRRTLVRNAALAGIAAAVTAAGPGKHVAAPHLSPLPVALAVVTAVVVGQGWFAWQLFRQHGRLLARLRALEERAAEAPSDGLPVGAVAPPLEALDDALADGGPVALVFSNSGCGACAALAPELERMRGGAIVLVEDDRPALEAYRIPIVPAAVIVGADGRIASRTGTGTAAVSELLAHLDPDSRRLRLAVG